MLTGIFLVLIAIWMQLLAIYFQLRSMDKKK